MEATVLQNFGHEQTDAAEDRLPYHSTFVQLNDVRGAEGKFAVKEANDLENIGEYYEMKANTRIPYASTLT